MILILIAADVQTRQNLHFSFTKVRIKMKMKTKTLTSSPLHVDASEWRLKKLFAISTNILLSLVLTVPV